MCFLNISRDIQGYSSKIRQNSSKTLRGGNTTTLRQKAKLDFDRKKKKEKVYAEHRTYANPAAKPAAQSQTQRGMRKYNRSMQ
jgi:hypothetical protein